MRKENSDEIEFRYSRFGGHAKGRFAILVFAGLVALAFIASMFICWRLTTVGIAYSERLGDSYSQTVKTSLGEKKKEIRAETRRHGEGVTDIRIAHLFEFSTTIASRTPPRLRVKFAIETALRWRRFPMPLISDPACFLPMARTD